MNEADAYYRRVENQFAFYHNMTIQEFVRYCIDRLHRAGLHPTASAQALYDALAVTVGLPPHTKE